MPLPAEVLHLTSNPGRGGIAAQARDFCEALTRQGCPASLFLLSTDGLDAACLAWYAEKISVAVVTPTIESAGRIGRSIALWRMFLQRPERLFHFHSISHEFLDWQSILAAVFAHKRVVVTLHHITGSKRRRSLTMATQWIAWRLVGRFIVTTRAARAIVAQSIQENRIAVLPCAVAAGLSIPRADARRDSAMDDDWFLIACVCRISRYKGVFALAQAVAELSDEFPKLHLAIAGIGTDYDALHAEWGNHDRIHLMGRIDDPNVLYAASNLFAMPSSEEGFGLVYVEAALHGVPSIACTLPTVKEVVLDGETGWLIEPENVEQLKAVIREALRNPAEVHRRGENARAHAAQFEIGRVTAQLIDLYDELIGRPPNAKS